MASTPIHPIQPATPRWLRIEVRSFMRSGVVTITEDSSLLQAQRAMLHHDVHAVLVVRRTGMPLGWVTTGGLMPWLGHEPSLIPAARAVSETPTRIEPSASAAEALALLAEPGTTHLLVSGHPEGPPQGVVAEIDLIRLAASATS